MLELRRGEAGGLYYLELAPTGAPRDLPLVVGLHGRGAAAEDLGGLVHGIDDQRYRYILFYAPLVLQMGDGLRYAWFERDSPAPEVSVPAAREKLVGALHALWERYDGIPARTALFGFSQGGVMTLDVGLHLDQRLAALVCMSGRLFEDENLAAALRRAHDRDEAILIVHGTADSRIPIDDARSTRAALERANLRPEYHEFAMDHEVTPDSLAAVRAFISRQLPVVEAPAGR